MIPRTCSIQHSALGGSGETYTGRCTGDPKRCGDVGESEYGLKADIMPVLGEGINGDFNAIIAG